MATSVPSIVPVLPIHFDSTMRSTLVQCPQKYFNEFCLGLRPAAHSIHLHTGGCFASAIESVGRSTWVEGRSLPEALDRAYGAYLDEWGDFPVPDKSPKTMDAVWASVEQYFEKYPPATDHIQPYFSADYPTFEFTFAIPLDFPGFPLHPSGQPFIYCGRWDLFGQYKGLPIIRDEKTAQAAGSNWTDQWRLRGQFLGYCWAAQQLGIKVNTICVRGAIIQKTDPRQLEFIKTYPQYLVDAWFEQLRHDMWRLTNSWSSGANIYFDKAFGDACSSYGGCPFTTLCESPHPERWYSQYTVRHWNPLDRNPIRAPEEIEAMAARAVRPKRLAA